MLADASRRVRPAWCARVVQVLVTKYSITAARLAAQGVGSLSPVASNGSEAGRAKNRRVELVEQSRRQPGSRQREPCHLADAAHGLELQSALSDGAPEEPKSECGILSVTPRAGVAKLADARDSKSRSPKGSVGSIPSSGTSLRSRSPCFPARVSFG